MDTSFPAVRRPAPPTLRHQRPSSSIDDEFKEVCLFSLKLQVDDRLKELETVNTFTDFVQAFSQFGSDMVELAHLSGDRQNVSVLKLLRKKCLHFQNLLSG